MMARGKRWERLLFTALLTVGAWAMGFFWSPTSAFTGHYDPRQELGLGSFWGLLNVVVFFVVIPLYVYACVRLIEWATLRVYDVGRR
jgi:hypothetical protein